MESDSTPTTFGARLAARRRAAGLTQDELGEYLGIGGAAVSAWEKERNQPNASQIAAICARLNVSADYLVGNERERT